jgi:hypothetical protein
MKGGFVHQHQDIDGIAVVGFGRGNETEIVRKRHSRRQNLLQFENVIVRIEGELVPASFGSFDNNPKQSVCLPNRRG